MFIASNVFLQRVVLLAAACVLMFACGDEQVDVPSGSVAASGGEVMRFPVQADGEIDTTVVAAIQFADQVHEFGIVDAGAIVAHRFPFRNTGSQPLIISSARSTCGCTVPEYSREPIAPGDTSSILVVFDTQGKAGPQDKPVTLTANTYPSTTTVRMKGTVDQLN